MQAIDIAQAAVRNVKQTWHEASSAAFESAVWNILCHTGWDSPQRLEREQRKETWMTDVFLCTDCASAFDWCGKIFKKIDCDSEAQYTLELSKGTTCPLVTHTELLWMDSHFGSRNRIIVYCYDRWASAVLWFSVFLTIQGPVSMLGLTMHFSCSILPSTSHVFHSLFRWIKSFEEEKR